MVDADGGIITLPPDVRGWHVGANGNSVSIGFEICEPAMMAYVPGSNNSRVDADKYNIKTPGALADFMRRYNNAVEMAVHMCRATGLTADDVICHQEAAQMGMATNHADVVHWFPIFGKNMDMFRADVAASLSGNIAPSAPVPTTPETPFASYVARVTASILNIRSGPGTEYAITGQVRKGEAYTITDTQNNFGRLKSGAGWVSLSYMEKI